MTTAEAIIARDVALYGSARLFQGTASACGPAWQTSSSSNPYGAGEWVSVGRYITRDEVEEAP